MPSSSSGNATTATLQLIPLPYGVVLLPGIQTRISLTGRPDVARLLAHVYSKASTNSQHDHSGVTVGCVPLSSRYLSSDGKRLIADAADAPDELIAPDPVQARASEIFDYGVVGRVTDVRGRPPGEVQLVIEASNRFKIQEMIRDTPFLEARVAVYEDVILTPPGPHFTELFAQLKQLSKELIALIRLAALMPRSVSLALSPTAAKRLEMHIARKDVHEAGVLADFMASIVGRTHAEGLRVLSTLAVPERMEMVIELLQKKIEGLQGSFKGAKVMQSLLQNSPLARQLDIESLNWLRQDPRLKSMGNGKTGGGIGFPPGLGAGGGSGQGDEEANEIEELKKRLDEAGLSPEAKKVAERELKRLAKLNPAQAEHQVARNYLENLSEIPWTRITQDNLDAATLSRARAQLNNDHYGLDKVKKRLLEYLAVLKLKAAMNTELDRQIQAIAAAEDRPNSKQQGAKSEIDGVDSAGQGLEKQDLKPHARSEKSHEEIELLKHKKLVDKSPILLLVGPPGTGKTSLAKSMATSLGRQFHRVSLGGVRDEAEIRGHRRTYVAAMPGLIVNGLKKVGVANPVMLLDEIDKVGTSSFHGDPSAAMLEVLDPEQNNSFVDHYVNIPIDLSKVLFIATANTLDTIPPPLLDRMETITLSGYTSLEKRHIATRHLIPKQIKANGLVPEHIELPEAVLDKIITGYTRESGVRNLEREIGSVCRAKAVQFAEARDHDALSTYTRAIAMDNLEDMLGVVRFEDELAAKEAQPGVVTGLVAFSTGTQGSILFIEMSDTPGSGQVRLTGKLGDVLKESVEVALTWVKAHACALGLTHDPAEDLMRRRAVHVHCPSGAIPKDGPSAGLAHTVALISLFSGKVVPPTVAMTGEMSLRGLVLPVGGIREKLIGALRAGVKKVVLPEQNRKDVRDLPDEVLQGLEIVHVTNMWEAMEQIWEGGAERGWGSVLSRL